MDKIGTQIVDLQRGSVLFKTFAYNCKTVELLIRNAQGEKTYELKEETPNLFSIILEGLDLDMTLYKYILDKKGPFPDPYSQYQPSGVHGFSQVINQNKYLWHDSNWQGIPPEKLIIMEIHTGTFTTKGDFQAAIERLDYLLDLGINTLEIMPVTQTPGGWNWGYDGTSLFSINHNYGTPDDLKYLVDCCHQKGLAVILDVVYNHFGPEGNYLTEFGPYFTHKHKTPWGAAVNYDDSYSQYTRAMVLDNVKYWLETFHLDGLRLDAVHEIKDDSEQHILSAISSVAQNISRQQKRPLTILAESDENDVKLISPLKEGGLGMTAQWMDDFHHTIHTVLTKEHKGYYKDYGPFKNLEKVYKNFLYTGQYSSYWGKNRGTDAAHKQGCHFVVAIQNHDQVGNRAYGDRLSTLVEFPYLKAAAGLLMFSPYIPLLFMGEEYGEKNPFLFFTDYQDPTLKKAVSQGRLKEFKHFGWDKVPDPQDPETFRHSKLTPRENWIEQNRQLHLFYRDLIKLRTSHPVLQGLSKERLEIKTQPLKKLLFIQHWHNKETLYALANLDQIPHNIEPPSSKILLDSEQTIYGGQATGIEKGGPHTLLKGQFIVYEAN